MTHSLWELLYLVPVAFLALGVASLLSGGES
jgi:hypothetical protein